MESVVYLDNNFIPVQEAKISIFDLSISRGYGVCEYLRTYNRSPFYLREHLLRLESSAREVGLCLPKNLSEITVLTEEIIERSSCKEVGIKFILTGGLSHDGYEPSAPSHFIIIASPFICYPESYYQFGVAIDLVEHERHFPSAKTTEYLSTIVTLQQKREKEFIDVLFVNRKGSILEAGYANFFAFKGKTLLTPAEGILKGITRKVVLELAKDQFFVEERAIDKAEIPEFDAVFLTSSNKEIMPVIQIGDHRIGKGVVSSSTRLLMKAFSSHAYSGAVFSFSPCFLSHRIV